MAQVNHIEGRDYQLLLTEAEQRLIEQDTTEGQNSSEYAIEQCIKRWLNDVLHSF